MALTATAAKGLKVCLIDVVGAFLNAKPQGETSLKFPKASKTTITLNRVSTPFSKWS